MAIVVDGTKNSSRWNKQHKPEKKSVYNKERYEQKMGKKKPEKKSVYNKERYEQNMEEISRYRRERYRCVPNVFLVCS